MTDDGIELRGKRVEFHAKEHRCTRCGGTTTSLGSVCLRCLSRDWWTEAYRLQARWLADDPVMMLPLDRKKRRHVGMIGRPELAYCGTKLVDGGTLNLRMEAFPPEVCVLCRMRLDKVLRGEFDDASTTETDQATNGEADSRR